MPIRHLSIYAQAVYMLLAGPLLVLAPNTLMTLVGIPPSSEFWPRVLGLLVSVVALFYLAIAREGYTKLMRLTVLERLIFCAGLVVFVLLDIAPTVLLLFAAVETALAVWTYIEIRT